MNLVGVIGILLQITWIILLVISIRKLKRKRFQQSAIVFMMFIVCLCYWTLSRDRILLIKHLYRPFPEINNAFFTYISTYHRYPLNIDELKYDSICGKILHEKLPYPWFERPCFLKEPNYGVKTKVEDTLIFTELYSYGLDYDDDFLEKEYYFRVNSPHMRDYAKYVLLPFSRDGDILVERTQRSIWDPFFDTVFVRQMFELQGDTLSPEEYEAWLKKRKEYR